jgi:hypothetical protein
MTLTIDEVIAELHRAGLPADHQPGENGVMTLCPVCPKAMAWTEDWQRWICDNPDCPSHANPERIGYELFFRAEQRASNGNGNGGGRGWQGVPPLPPTA